MDNTPLAEYGKATVRRRLWGSQKTRIPYIQQLETADCGAACLAMVLHSFGKSISLSEARALLGSSRGTDALSLIQASESQGLRGRGVQVEVDELRHLSCPSILHWNFNHFVVLERARHADIDIIDPAYGRRRIPLDKARRHFTGVALLFERADHFVQTPPGRSKAWGILTRLRAYPGLILRILAMSIAMRLLALALPVFTALIVDRVVPRGDHSMLLVVSIGIAGILGFQALSLLVRAHLLIALRAKLDVRMSVGFVAHLLMLPYAFFGRRSAGDLVMRVQSNTQIRELLASSLLSTLIDGTFAFAYLVLLVVISPLLAVVAAFAGTLQIIVLLVSRNRYAMLASQDLETQARTQSYLVQMLVGIETLKIAGAERHALQHWTNLYVDELNVELSRSRMMAVVDSLNGLFQAAAPLVLLGVGSLLVINNGLSLGMMLATIALATGFLTPLSSLVSSVLQLQTLGSYLERIDDVMATEPELQSATAVLPLKLSGAIDLEGVSFRYSATEPTVIQNVTLHIEAGTTVAIVGRSGSGKSTLAGLLIGLHRPTKGRILYDGLHAVGINHRVLRQQLSMVPQSPYIFSGSIRQNIALANPELAFDRVVAAARRANIHDDIVAFPMAYDTVVSDGGTTLSGGQRQRIALARALIADPAVLLLDEATSALDATTERQVMEQLRGLRATRVVIAHRLSTIVGADRIVVLDGGRIVESGTHDELLAANGKYAELVADQTFDSSIR